MLHLVLSLLSLTPQQSAQLVLREDFDEPGTAWSATLFPDLLLTGNTAFTREELSTALGAPSTIPPLPINAGGDLEGRFAEVTLGSGSYALTADTPENRLEDAALRGYVAIGNPDPFGGQTVGFLLRANIEPHPPFGTGLNAYTAEIVHNGGQTSASVYLSRWRNGVIRPPDLLASAAFPIDLANENYRIEFRVEGDLLSVRLWRVTAAGGSVVLAPIPLGTGPGGSANLLTARDSELTAGRAGLSAFARGGNSVFWDDVELVQPGDKLGGLGMPPSPPKPAAGALRR